MTDKAIKMHIAKTMKFLCGRCVEMIQGDRFPRNYRKPNQKWRVCRTCYKIYIKKKEQDKPVFISGSFAERQRLKNQKK